MAKNKNHHDRRGIKRKDPGIICPIVENLQEIGEDNEEDNKEIESEAEISKEESDEERAEKEEDSSSEE